MAAAISKASSWACFQLQSSLLPVQGNLLFKVACYALQFFKFCLFLPLAITTSTLSFFFPKKRETPLVAFAKRPEWSAELMHAAPLEVGFSTADFQDNGPACHPETNWGKYYQLNAHKLGDLGEMPDMWNHPERVIQMLNQLGCKKFRFSISRDKVEPRPGQPFDLIAMQRYRNFCRSLREHEIEPMVTLHHFSDPTYFSWEKEEDIEGFVRYADAVSAALYQEGVRKIITINEPTVLVFQGWIMGEFPPHRKIDFQSAGRVMENMMRAHARVYKAIKARFADFEVGISHNPVRFRHFHKTHPLWSPVERILCHYLTELNHTAFMRFLQTGTFSLKVPFRTNFKFTLSEKLPLDFIGLQYYTDPLIKLSLTKAQSVSRVPNEKLSSYEYRIYPQGLASALEEFGSLNIPIDITETGIDIGINTDPTDKERIRHFDRLFQAVEKAKERGVPVRSLHFWTLTDNLEWYKAWAVRFGFFHFDQKTGQSTPRPAAHWLRERIAARNALIQNHQIQRM